MVSPAVPRSNEAPPELSFRFRWDFREHVRLHKAIQREVSKRGVTRWIVRGVVGFLVLLGLLFLLVVAGTQEGRRLAVVLSYLPYVAVMAFWIWLWKVGIPYQAARAFRRGNRCLDEDMVRTLSADGVGAYCATSTSFVRWEGIHRVKETDEFVLFFTAPNCAIQLPQRAIPSEADREALRRRIRTALGSRAELFQSGPNAPAA